MVVDERYWSDYKFRAIESQTGKVDWSFNDLNGSVAKQNLLGRNNNDITFEHG